MLVWEVDMLAQLKIRQIDYKVEKIQTSNVIWRWNRMQLKNWGMEELCDWLSDCLSSNKIVISSSSSSEYQTGTTPPGKTGQGICQ